MIFIIYLYKFDVPIEVKPKQKNTPNRSTRANV